MFEHKSLNRTTGLTDFTKRAVAESGPRKGRHVDGGVFERSLLDPLQRLEAFRRQTTNGTLMAADG